jgi:FkbM family methyltransferase
MAYGNYEMRDLAAIRPFIKPGDTVVDGGANVGYFAAHLADMVGPNGKVYAFEPGPTPLAFLRQTGGSNRFGTIEVVAFALSNRAGTGTFFETEDILAKGYGRIDVRPSAKFSKVGEFIVPVTSIDAFFADRDVSRLTFIKIDVEGQEKQVIWGMSGLLDSGYRPVLLTEVTITEDWIGELRDYAAFLAQFGYRMYAIDGGLHGVKVDDLKPGFHGNVIWAAGGSRLPQNGSDDR